jgi:hypothetical protein
MINGADIATELSRKWDDWKAYQPDGGKTRARTLREAIDLYKAGKWAAGGGNEVTDIDGDPVAEFTSVGGHDRRLDGPGRRWASPPRPPGALPPVKKRPAPPAVAGRGGEALLVPLARAAEELAKSRGIRIDVDHPYQCEFWPILGWLRLELEICGWEWDFYFYDQLVGEMESGEEAEYTTALLPLYNIENTESSQGLVELLEDIRLRLAGKLLTKKLHLPGGIAEMEADVDAGGGLKMKTKRSLFTAEEIRRAELALDQCVRNREYCTGMPEGWAKAIETLRPEQFPPRLGPIFGDGWDCRAEIRTGKLLGQFLERARAIGQLRLATDVLYARCFDDPEGFWREFVAALLARRRPRRRTKGKTLLETLTD